jgi:hypothetical protein
VQVSKNRGCVVSELTPRNSHHPPAVDLQEAIPFPIPLECPSRAVRRTTVELNDDALLGPEAVGFEESSARGHVGIPPWSGQVSAVEQERKPFLQHLAGDAPHGGLIR